MLYQGEYAQFLKKLNAILKKQRRRHWGIWGMEIRSLAI